MNLQSLYEKYFKDGYHYEIMCQLAKLIIQNQKQHTRTKFKEVQFKAAKASSDSVICRSEGAVCRSEHAIFSQILPYVD